MSTEITTQQNSMLSIIERVATDESVDADKLERILNMQERIFDKNAEIQFNEAMADCQSELKPILKMSENRQTNSGYVKLDLIIKHGSPVWTKHGFALSFGTDNSSLDNHVGITCIVSHRAGFSRTYRWDLPLDNAGIKGSVNKTPIHASGSTVSYGRRYLTCMIFNIATQDDDDGQAANSPDAQPLTKTQIKVINDLLDDTNTKILELLGFFNIDGENVEDIPPSQYSRIVSKLKQKQGDKK